jgi:AraC-like DNA-binding protein
MEWHRLARHADFVERRLAQQLGVTQRTIQSWWKDMGGPPLEAWLLEQRLGIAIPLLELFGSVKEAAALAGYSDPTVFGRLFKRCHGLTPGEYLAAFQTRSPWWSDKEMRHSLLAMQNDCRTELGKRSLSSKSGSLVGKV